MEELKNCPACKGTQYTFLRKCKDFTVSGKHFNLVECSTCKLIFTNPRPDASSIGKYYESSEYISHSNSKKGIVNQLYQIVRSYSLKNKLKLINNLGTTSKQILDIGCGTGEFLAVCKENGWKTVGIEPNDKARSQAVENWGLSVFPESHLDLLENNEGLSVISMWHVLEHVHSLDERLIQISALLSSSGYFVVAVPNKESWDAKYYSDVWAAYDVPRHLYHFSPAVIKTFVGKYGFEHITSIAMKFDSFYVSMLSEKHKTGKQSLLKALFIGLWSNIKASGNPEKYSSVIYIFKKN